MAALFYVMGPSGAGKDSVLRYARSRLSPDDRIAFAHRYITRAGDPSEDFISLSRDEFLLRQRLGLFIYSWDAHGQAYGIGAEARLWREAGLAVVISGSRQHFQSMSPAPEGTVPVLVTASPEVCARRLAVRARESSDAVTERLSRTDRFLPPDDGIMIIDNSGPLAEAGDRLLAILRSAG